MPYSTARSHAGSDMAYDLYSTSSRLGAESPEPLVNTQYRLAGGLDTPTAAIASAMESRMEDESPELHLRGGRGFRGHDPTELDGYFSRISSALARESNGRPRLPRSPGIRDGLGNVVYRFVGVAGKVWENWTSAFRGFYAGGGQGYEMRGMASGQQGLCKVDQSFVMDDGMSNSVPGRFPEEDFIPDYMSLDHRSLPRAAKKSKREEQTGEISANWVMLGSPPPSRDTSPSRLSHRKIPPASASGRRPIPKLGRRPILPASRPSLSSYAGSPGLRSENASYASPRSPVTSPKHESPVSVEVQRHKARMRKRELEEDANLKRFNQQLKAMIREGKEALGTKFEVQDENDEPVDEGYGEGDDIFHRDRCPHSAF